VKNWLLKFFSLLRYLLPKNIGNRFLIVSTTGLGDTLWGTPAIRALRKTYPGAYIGVLTTPLGKEVLKNNPHIDEFFVLRHLPIFSLLALLSHLRRRRIAKIFIFHTSQRPILPFCTWLGASHIVATAGINKGLDSLLTQPMPAKRQHEIQRRLEIVGCFGDVSMEIFPSSASPLQETSPPIPVVGLHPGAKDLFKQWPPSHFIALGNRLKDHLGCHIVVTGGPEEKELVTKIVRGIEGAKAMTAPLSISDLAALIQQMALLVTNDTGPMHIACAVKTPALALFCPTDPILCGPYHVPKSRILQKPITCTPCLKKKCRDPFCMRQIGIEDAFQNSLALFYG
jgi:ADP-heptose:LPS heptosyltransferase